MCVCVCFCVMFFIERERQCVSVCLHGGETDSMCLYFFLFVLFFSRMAGGMMFLDYLSVRSNFKNAISQERPEETSSDLAQSFSWMQRTN